jgi:hypothetical protein
MLFEADAGIVIRPEPSLNLEFCLEKNIYLHPHIPQSCSLKLRAATKGQTET